MYYTAEDFYTQSLKTSLTKWWKDAQAEADSGGPYAQNAILAMQARRHPDTVFSDVLSYEQVEAGIAAHYADPTRYLMIGYGVTLYSDGKAYFLTDDSMFGWRILKDCGFHACTFGLPLGTAHKLFKTVQEFAEHYSKGEKYLATIDELLTYLNAAPDSQALVEVTKQPDYASWIGKTVRKKSRKPFKSGARVGTVKSLTVNPNTDRPAFTFVEDDSTVDCHILYIESTTGVEQ